MGGAGTVARQVPTEYGRCRCAIAVSRFAVPFVAVLDVCIRVGRGLWPNVSWMRDESVGPEGVARVAPLSLLSQPLGSGGATGRDGVGVLAPPNAVVNGVAILPAEWAAIGHQVSASRGPGERHQRATCDGPIRSSVSRRESAVRRKLRDDVIGGGPSPRESWVSSRNVGPNLLFQRTDNSSAKELREEGGRDSRELHLDTIVVRNGERVAHGPSDTPKSEMKGSDGPSDTRPGA